MTNKVDFQHLAAIYGWKKTDELLFHEFGKLWQSGYYQQFETVEQLLFHPHASLKFAMQFRSETGLWELPVADILRKLTNLRKAKFLKDYEYDTENQPAC